ncbi:hypothetical protein ACIP4Q_19565 [Streptomyces massasporeus]
MRFALTRVVESQGDVLRIVTSLGGDNRQDGHTPGNLSVWGGD